VRRLAPLLLVVLAGCGGAAATTERAEPAAEPHSAVAREPAAKKPARPRGRWATARVTRATALRAAPDGRRVGRLSKRTEFGSPKVVGVLRERRGWLLVDVPERPNGRPAWIRAADTRPDAVDVSLRVDRSARRITVWREGEVVRRFRVAVGRPGTETPTGRFAVTDKLDGAAYSPVYGCCILALSAHQTHLPGGWTGGDRIAIHGGSTAGAVSNGCLHASTGALRYLMRAVPLGARAVIHP
jgi:hypothetical protein